MADDFPMQLKSTIDRLVALKAQALLGEHPTLQWAEVDDMAQTDKVFKADTPALLWQWGQLREHPKAPLYACDFAVGAKTTNDPGNYILLKLLGEIRDVFATDADYRVFDYTMPATEPADITDRGVIRICSNEIDEQGFDRQSGVRYAVIRAAVVKRG